MWESQPDEMREIVRLHDNALREVFETHGGHVFKTLGDAFCVAFDVPGPAIRAAIQANKAVSDLPGDLRLAVRMGIHTGTAEHRDNDYFGPSLNRVARLMAAGHGGQVLLSGATFELVRDDLPLLARTIDLGQHRLRDLARPEQIYQLQYPGFTAQFPSLRTLDSKPNNLPIQNSRFVGREKELHEIRKLMRESRLVTVAGPGGVGKTRTTLQASADLLDDFPDGVWLIELAGLQDESRVPWAVADALSVLEQPGISMDSTLKSALADREMLLIFDNCEHVISAAALLIDGLLRNSAKVRILASSREPLNVSGEQVYRLPSLSVGAESENLSPAALEQYEAVQLFIDRALLILPHFRVDNQNAPAVAGICARLDGIPLAIELAAARLRMLSVQEVNGRLDNAFRLLTSGTRHSSARQQTLRGAIDWSYDLLEEKERTVLRRLSVFRGPWPLEAAEQIVADGEFIESWEVMDAVASLVDKSLVMVDGSDKDSRYRLLETIRQYATEKLGSEEESTCDRHLAYYEAEARNTAAASREVAGDIDIRLYHQGEDIRAALAWCMSKPDSAAETLAFACDLHRPVLLRWSFRETAQLWERMLERSDQLPPDRILLNSYSHASWYMGRMFELDRARYWAEKGVAIADQIDDPLAKGRVLNSLGSLCYQLEQYEEAEVHFREAIRIVEPSDSFQADIALYGNLGNVMTDAGQIEEAREAYRRAEVRAVSADDLLGQSIIARHVGDLEIGVMNFKHGMQTLEVSYGIASEIPFEHYMTGCLTHLFGYLPFIEPGGLEGATLARQRLEKGVQIAHRIGAGVDEYEGRIHLIEVCSFLGDFASAADHIAHLPGVKAQDKVTGELYRACAWLALALDSPERASALEMAAERKRGKSRATVTPFEREMSNRLRGALDPRTNPSEEVDMDSLIAELVTLVK